MVDPDNQKRNRAEYSLDAIHRIASKGDVNYGSTRVQRDITNLGYDLEEVCLCLQKLTKTDYVESVLYSDKGPWLDVYKCSWQHVLPDSDDNEIDPLYIKLRLNRDCITILLQSFHREGAL